jgi:cardiolipin synthase
MGCATSLPHVESLTEATPSTPPQIMGPHGKLTQSQAKAALSRKQPGPAAADLVKNTVKLMESLTGHPLTAGNSVTLLIDGAATYGAMLTAMEAAKESINVEMYTFADDEVGRKFADLLVKKRSEGVRVNLMYDAIGSLGTPKAFFQRLKDADINVVEFNPVDPSKARKGLRLTQRDHRKVIVVDGRVGFTGGVNISSVYSSGSSMKEEASPVLENWRDTDVRIEGPAVAQLQRSFMEVWKYHGGPPLVSGDYFPFLPAKGKALAEVVGSWRGEKNRLTYVLYVAAIQHAHDSVHLTTPYFVPDHQMKKAMADAAKRGVEITVVVPSLSDSNLVLFAGRSHYEDLLEAGVRIFERRDRMVHAKTATIDGFWSTVGSTNMDLWSFARNNEINVIVVDAEFADQVEQMFTDDLAASREITRKEWSRRPFSSRLKEFFARLVSHWL